MLAPVREIHRRDHTSKEDKMRQHKCLPMHIISWREALKVQSDLKQRFITLAWPELQKSAMLWAWGPHAVAETLEGACLGQTHVERAQGAPRRGWLEEPVLHHDRHGDPPRQGVVLVEVTLPRLGSLGVFSNGPRQRIVERGARIFPRGG